MMATKTDFNPLSRTVYPLFPGLIVLSVLFVFSQYNYLVFHTLAEFFSIVVAWSLFVIVWNTRQTIENDALVFLGIVYLFIGSVDLAHALSYKGMGVLGPEQGANPATQLWIASRYMESISLCLFPFLFNKRINHAFVFWMYSIVTIVALLSIFLFDIFPACFIDGVGLTTFKKSSEYIICLLLIASLLFLHQKQKMLDKTVYKFFVISIWMTIISELAFTYYVSVYGFSNLIGHLFKIASFYMIYKAIAYTGLKNPLNFIFKELSEKEHRYRQMFETNQAVKLIINPENGSIVEANDAACRFYGYSKDELTALTIFKINALSPDKVTEEMERARSGNKLVFNFPHRLASGETREVEIYSGPVQHGEKTFLHSIIHDVTKRKQAERLTKRHIDNLNAVFNSVPNILMVINEKGRVEMLNDKGVAFWGKDNEHFSGLLSGEIFNCLNSFDGKGCGRNPDCSKCEVRHAIISTFETGKTHSEEECRMTILNDGVETYMDFLITTALLKLDDASKVLLSLSDITKRKQSEQALIKSEEKFRDMVSSIPGAVFQFVLRPDGEIDIPLVSQGAESLFNRTVEELRDLSTIQEVLHPDDILMMKKSIQQSARDLSCRQKDFRIYVQNDETKWLRGISTPRKLGDGSICWSGILIDVTEQKTVEKRDKGHKQEIESIFRSAPTGIGVVSDRIITKINARVEEISGYSQSELIGKNARIFYPSDKEFEYVGQEKYRQIKNYGTGTVETKWKRRDDKIIDVLMSSTPIDFEDFSKGVTFTVLDITSRRKTEDTLRFQALILDQIQDHVTATDLDGNIIYANAAECKSRQQSRKELIGSPAEPSGKALKRGAIQKQIIETTLKNGKWHGEVVSRAVDGIEKTMDCRTQLLRSESGEPISIISTSTDITEQKKITERLLQAQKMESIGNLAGGIAHDFNNLLFPIIGLAEMLAEDLPPDSPERENAIEIQKAGQRGGELVKQILAFSRQNDHNLTPTRLQFVMKEVLKLSRASIPMNIEITHYLQKDCGLVFADSTQLHQIGMNLITNAYHSVLVNGGNIDVQVRETSIPAESPDRSLGPGKYAMLSVSDNGTGIGEEDIKKIFEPYFTTKDKDKGTGLGLSVVYGIVKEHKGDIRVMSEVGKGTTFEIYLPLMDISDVEASDSVRATLQSGNERILLVDDELPIVQLEKLILERLGYQISERTSSPDALEAFRKNPYDYDLVISDMSMPHMTGDQLARKMISIRPDIPIIICTGFSERIDEKAAKAIGVKGFLMKPVVRSVMAGEIRKVLDEK